MAAAAGKIFALQGERNSPCAPIIGSGMVTREAAHLDERELLVRARGEPAALTEFYRRHYRRIYTYAYRRCGRRADAEDIAAAVFESVLRSLPRYQPGPEPPLAWLYRIASRRLNDHFRRRVPQPVAVLPAGETGVLGLAAPSDPAAAAEATERAAAVQAALAELGPRDRQVVELAYLLEATRSEMAAILGCSPDNVSVRLHRALKRLGQILRSMGVNDHDA